MYDTAIIGGGIAGFSSALRLQVKGQKTIVLEAHGQLGGCAGFFTKKGFAFDVGATTLVDFEKGGVGGNFFDDIKLPLLDGEYIDYIAWLPDRKVTLYRDKKKWAKERLEKLGSTKNHIAFWQLMDKVTEVFWTASRQNLKLPFQNIQDIVYAIKVVGFRNLHLARYLNYTMLDVLKKFKLDKDKPLKGLLSMLIEDTVHSTIDKAPFINAALGTTIRGAGLMRAKGGMKGFWDYVGKYYKEKGGISKRGNRVLSIKKQGDIWEIKTTKSTYNAKKIISSLPLELTHRISPNFIQNKLNKYIQKNEAYQGSAMVLFLGIKDAEVDNQSLTHHQILLDYDAPLGNGNNMFISISAKNDVLSAPLGHRSVMISTHCRIEEWMNLSKEDYLQKKEKIGNQLLKYAQKVYPKLGQNPIVFELGTPQTYQKYTHRINGGVGGYKQTLANTNLKAVPQNIGVKNFWLVGDTTWPGLGTVAGLIGSRIAADYAYKA